MHNTPIIRRQRWLRLNQPFYLVPMRRPFHILALLALVSLALSLGGCYSFSATSLPPHIKSVTIEEVENLTTDPNLAQRLRDGIVDMFQRNAPGIRILPEGGDSRFSIRLTGYTNAPENYSRDASVETYKATITVDVSFRDLSRDSVKNPVIYEGRGLRGEGVYDVAKNETEDRHGQARAIEKLQDLIVNNALARW